MNIALRVKRGHFIFGKNKRASSKMYGRSLFTRRFLKLEHVRSFSKVLSVYFYILFYYFSEFIITFDIAERNLIQLDLMLNQLGSRVLTQLLKSMSLM